MQWAKASLNTYQGTQQRGWKSTKHAKSHLCLVSLWKHISSEPLSLWLRKCKINTSSSRLIAKFEKLISCYSSFDIDSSSHTLNIKHNNDASIIFQMENSKMPVPSDSVERDHLIMQPNPDQGHSTDARSSTSDRTQNTPAVIANPEVNIEILGMFKGAFNAAPDMTSPTLAYEKRARGVKPPTQNEDKIKVFEHILRANDEHEKLVSEFLERVEKIESAFNHLELETLFSQTRLYVNDNKDHEAERTAHAAMELAKKMNSEIDTARASFWLGRVAFMRNQIPLAHQYFVAAYPCAADDRKRDESLDIDFFRDVTRPGINRETLNVRVDAYQWLLDARLPYDAAFINSIRVADGSKEITRDPNVGSATPRAQQIKQRPRKYLKPRCPGTKQKHGGEGKSPQAVFDVAKSPKDQTHWDINNLARVLGGTLVEELGYKSEDTNGSFSNTTSKHAGPGVSDAPDNTANGEDETSLRNSSATHDQLKSSSSPKPPKPFIFGDPHTPTSETQFRMCKSYVGEGMRSRPGNIFAKLHSEVQPSHDQVRNCDEN